MKLRLSALTLSLALFCAGAFAQTPVSTYAQLMEQGGAQMQAKDFCGAAATFEQAFRPDSTRANEFELFAGAMAAANCPSRRPLAWRWLSQLSRHRPLRMQPQDLDNVANDPALAPLRTEAAWPRWLAAMRQALADQTASTQAASTRWISETQTRTLPAAEGKFRKTAPAGFALYFSQVPADTVRMPYLVRVPAGYDPTKPATVVVYLHGGVVNTRQFGYADPDVVKEPIFEVAPANALVVYPFGRASFGWVEQPAAFAQIERILAEVQARYRTDGRHTVLGGMSNGGSAALWFASQRPAPFSGFYALSPAPKLPLQASYGRLGQGKPCYQLSAQNDSMYHYTAVKTTYEARPSQATKWFLQTIPSGGHSFLYSPPGPALLRETLATLCGKPNKR